MMKTFNFTIQHQAALARAGQLIVGKKTITTPTVVHSGKTLAVMSLPEIAQAGGQVIAQRTLDYWLTGEPVTRFGDLHDRLHWSGLIIGDPGTKQAYQWAKPRGRKADGVRFHEPATGQLKFYTPDIAYMWQDQLGSDLGTSFARWDDYYAPVDDLKAGADQTAAWLGTVAKQPGMLATVVGGGLKRVRQSSIMAARQYPFAGYALGGIDPSVKLHEQERILQEITALLPHAGLRYLPAAGSLEQVLIAMLSGVDLVESDCAASAAGHGVAFLGTKRLHLDKQHFIGDNQPIDPQCSCPTCQAGYSRAYLHQLWLSQAPLCQRLLTVHNLFVVNTLVNDFRQAIINGQLTALKERWAID